MPLSNTAVRKRMWWMLAITDIVTAIASVLASIWLLRVASSSIGLPDNHLIDTAVAAVLIVVVGVVALLSSQSTSQVIAGMQLYSSALRIATQALALAAIVAYAFGLEARALLGLLVPLLPAGLIAERWILRQVLRWQNRRSDELPIALLIGSQAELEVALKSDGSLGYQPISLLNVNNGDEVATAIMATSASAVILDRQLGNASEFRNLVWRAEELGCRVMVSTPVGLMAPNDIAVIPTASNDLMVLSSASLQLSNRFAKRGFDLLVTPVLVVITSPLLLLGMLMVLIGDGAPLFYKGKRVGVNGMPFAMYKLRTLRTSLALSNVTQISAANMSKSKEVPTQATRVGSFLRRWSIDELPQLFQVISGTMSLVGPRPRLPCEHDDSLVLMRRLKVKPGLTGLWQVNGRGDLPLNEAAELDVRYVDSWSMFGDVVILLRTLKTVITGRGAR